MATVTVFAVLCLFASVFSSDVPVLIWSPDRPLSDMPQAPAGESIPQETFNTKYLGRLLDTEPGQVIVAFLQDKLHIDDISKYADVYNPSSDGGAFKNIKGLLDEHFSLELPHVLDSHKALGTLRSKFQGAVHDVTSAADLSQLDLDGKQNYLLIVRLKPVATAKNEEAAIAANDQLVGQVAEHLQKRSVRYTALYTAESSESQGLESHVGRRLMEDVPDVDDNGVFLNISYSNGSLFMYITHISFCMYTAYNPDTPPTVCDVTFTAKDLSKVNFTGSKAEFGANNTLLFTLSMQNVKGNSSGMVFDFTIVMPLSLHIDRWVIGPLDVTLKSPTNASLSTVSSRRLTTRSHEYDTVVNVMYSYHCSEMNYYQTNLTNVPDIARLTLGGFQIQPFNTSDFGFSLSSDCVGWFNTAIWMALIPVSLNVVILFFGMYMIASLSTNDRFDDPKGKTLTINAGE